MRHTLFLLTILGITAAVPGFAADEPDAEWKLEPSEQEIEVMVTLPEDEYSYTVTGECAVGNQAINAEGYSDDGLGFNVIKDVYSGMTVFFTNNDDEWELTLDPPDDTSELEGNRFRFSGDVPRNYEEDDKQAMSIEVICTAS
ncbi:MAG: hypothetical protein QNJ11_18150 [Woeseiaceae bacterium]|nr:hypothetical protein [Woeseiaceae bacterium]